MRAQEMPATEETPVPIRSRGPPSVQSEEPDRPFADLLSRGRPVAIYTPSKLWNIRMVATEGEWVVAARTSSMNFDFFGEASGGTGSRTSDFERDGG